MLAARLVMSAASNVKDHRLEKLKGDVSKIVIKDEEEDGVGEVADEVHSNFFG